MVNKNCRPAVVQVHKVSGTRETTPLDKVNQSLQMTAAKANNDSCNDAQVNEEPPQQPLPPTKPDDDYAQFMAGAKQKPTPTLAATPTPTPTLAATQESIEEFSPYNMYYDSSINQTIQFLIVVLFGSGAYALWRATK